VADIIIGEKGIGEEAVQGYGFPEAGKAGTMAGVGDEVIGSNPIISITPMHQVHWRYYYSLNILSANTFAIL
jgi:hypothetical protein